MSVWEGWDGITGIWFFILRRVLENIAMVQRSQCLLLEFAVVGRTYRKICFVPIRGGLSMGSRVSILTFAAALPATAVAVAMAGSNMYVVLMARRKRRLKLFELRLS